ncbi:hypothetical protein CDL15_Pgr019750 [Punica granatum]|uniref:Auxin-responsive protein SAUR68-like n=1 Tax=Punica granatum TaxID=22663 RepID=A0A218X721_PUNGR|nr:hypothetical protein CDL15_Pgr019750 [Punica granatum]
MISPWKLIKLARKWQKVAVLGRRRISLLKPQGSEAHPTSSEAPPVAENGHFVVHTADQKRFEFPIKYLNNCIIRELLRLSEEEFGLPRDGPITLPCDANSMEHVILLIRGKKGNDLQIYDLIFSIPTAGCSSCSTHLRHVGQQLLACS